MVMEEMEEMGSVYIVSSSKSYVHRYRMQGVKTIFKFKAVPEEKDEIEWLKSGFAELVNEIKKDTTENDYIGFTLTSLNLKSKAPGYAAFRPANQISSDVLWDIFGGIIQSNEEGVKSTDTFQVECTKVSLPVGSGTRKRPGYFNSFSEECKQRKGIITIKNYDNLCLPRALIVGKYYAKKKNSKVLQSLRTDRKKLQTKKALVLIAKAQVDIPEKGCSLNELEKFQTYLKRYNITVYNFDTKGREVYYKGSNPAAQYKINLLFHDGHFNVITSLTAAFCCNFYCEACSTPFDHRISHRCKSVCDCCRTISPPCMLEFSGIKCSDCNRLFRNQVCFSAHQKEICESLKLCSTCNKHIRPKQRKDKHVCGEIFCHPCQKFQLPGHLCYIQVDKSKPMEKDFVYIFFDFESRQDENLDDDSNINLHKVNLCVSQQFCWECIDGKSCGNCMHRMRVFKENPVKQLVDYILEVRKKFKKVVVIAHNGGGYDYIFILKYILDSTKFIPHIIQRGSKLILMAFDNVKFVDSLNYLTMSLANLPKALGLPPEKKKGYFPHLFNTIKNQNYKGPIPAKEYYCPDSMFEKGKEQFDVWYDEQVKSNYIFDFQKEIVEYCISDVDILAQSCIKFRAMFLEICNVEPFLESTTIASACNLIYRRNFLKPETIGLIPKHGYRMVDNQSSIALQWLSWVEQERDIVIKHMGRQREIVINGMKVDGFDGQNIYEFQGCYFHGCPKCFPFHRNEPLRDNPADTLNLRYDRTQKKIEKLASSKYPIIQMWECDFKKIKKDKGLNHLNSLPILNTLPLNPRDAFFGGRTGNTKTYHKCDELEKIHYVDVCSLYPWVCKYKNFCLGHPSVYVGDKICRTRGMEVNGLMKCKILPPQNLYLPVLPVKMHEKLMFILCKTCGEDQNQDECPHDIEERALVGTWTMDELRVAVRKGYSIIHIYELWEFEMATYEKGGFFTEYINMFLKIKQEASGYPSWVKTEADKDKYITDYFDTEGILLNKDKICKNEGLRSISKTCLNNLWGYFAKRANQSQTQIIREPKELFTLLTTPEYQVNSIQEINAETLLVNFEYLDESCTSSNLTNVLIGVFTTAQARLKLYEELEQLDKQVNYFDTDSLIYNYKEGCGMYKVETGHFLGQLTCELQDYGVGSYITEFVSGGPKIYAYKVFSTNEQNYKYVCKVKGITLNYKTSQKINFENLKKMVLSDKNPILQIQQTGIRRTKDKQVVTIKNIKQFKITGPKRKYEGEYDTLPYGYKKLKV